MKKLITHLIIFLIIFFLFCAPNDVAYASTSARGMVLIDASTNRILYSHNELEQMPMASTTKIVTAITVLENCNNLDEVVTITRPSTLIEGTSIYLKEGEQLSIRQLLYGLMLQSGNDAAHALALHIGGSIENFANMMEQTAIKAGATNSSFTNPHGLDDAEHYTTAYDLALITSYALKNQDFKDIVSTKKFIINAGEKTTARTLINKNRLLDSLVGCIGVKTGYTSKAGRCLVTACERDGVILVCVVLNCRPMFEESAAYIEKAFDEFENVKILEEYSCVGEIEVIGGDKSKVNLYNQKGCTMLLLPEEKSNINIEYDLPNVLEAPISKNEVVGKVKIFYNNNLIFSENIYTMEDVKVVNKSNKLQDILDKWYGS